MPEIAIAASPHNLNGSLFSTEKDRLTFEILSSGFFTMENFRESIDGFGGKTLITLGKNEFTTLAGDARSGSSCAYLKGAANVECLEHDRGHIFPLKEIGDFLNRNLR